MEGITLHWRKNRPLWCSRLFLRGWACSWITKRGRCRFLTQKPKRTSSPSQSVTSRARFTPCSIRAWLQSKKKTHLKLMIVEITKWHAGQDLKSHLFDEVRNRLTTIPHICLYIHELFCYTLQEISSVAFIVDHEIRVGSLFFLSLTFICPTLVNAHFLSKKQFRIRM